jgi:hypothetical protein
MKLVGIGASFTCFPWYLGLIMPGYPQNLHAYCPYFSLLLRRQMRFRLVAWPSPGEILNPGINLAAHRILRHQALGLNRQTLAVYDDKYRAITRYRFRCQRPRLQWNPGPVHRILGCPPSRREHRNLQFGRLYNWNTDGTITAPVSTGVTYPANCSYNYS